MVKNALLSFKKNIGKTVLLLLVIIILVNLLICALAIRQTSNSLVEQIYANSNNEVTLMPNNDSQTASQITIDMANQLSNFQYVKNYNYNIATESNSSQINPIRIDINDDNQNNNQFIISANSSMANLNDFTNNINELIEYIGDKDFSVNVISKSGTTTEPAVAFRIFREILENKYGIDEARSRIYATTDKAKGALKTLAQNEGYEQFVVPDNVGGRYSVLTAVGLLPIAVAGIDIDKLMMGAKTAQDRYDDPNLKYNECYKYAVVRNILYKLYKNTEILVNYEPKMHYFTEWWKQLFGESEGKDQMGIFPAGVDFTTDLHSMGQYIQEGRRNLFETVISIKTPNSDITIHPDDDNLDGLNYLAGKGLDYVNKKAMEGTIKAHVSGDVPNIVIEMEKLDEENIGELIYFFEKACAMSGNILGVNPFNQPGVEEYKKNMFKLLEKPGY